MSGDLIYVLLRIFGALLIALAVYRAVKGSFRSEDSTGMDETLDRSRNPVRFWAQLVIQAIIGAVLALGVIRP